MSSSYLDLDLEELTKEIEDTSERIAKVQKLLQELPNQLARLREYHSNLLAQRIKVQEVS